MTNGNRTHADPMGLLKLETAVEALHSERRRLDPDVGQLVDEVEVALREVLEKFELLTDRYSLLKQSNAALCEELVWLRDQLDDMAYLKKTTK